MRALAPIDHRADDSVNADTNRRGMSTLTQRQMLPRNTGDSGPRKSVRSSGIEHLSLEDNNSRRILIHAACLECRARRSKVMS